MEMPRLKSKFEDRNWKAGDQAGLCVELLVLVLGDSSPLSPIRIASYHDAATQTLKQRQSELGDSRTA
jgi:hypothetical protein